MSGRYYPHNWDAINDAPEEFFDQVSYEDFMLWKLNGWEIPSSVACIMRAEHKDTGQIKEHVYKSPKHAVKRLLGYMNTNEYEVTVCNHDSISIVKNQDDPGTD